MEDLDLAVRCFNLNARYAAYLPIRGRISARARSFIRLPKGQGLSSTKPVTVSASGLPAWLGTKLAATSACNSFSPCEWAIRKAVRQALPGSTCVRRIRSRWHRRLTFRQHFPVTENTMTKATMTELFHVTCMRYSPGFPVYFSEIQSPPLKHLCGCQFTYRHRLQS